MQRLSGEAETEVMEFLGERQEHTFGMAEFIRTDGLVTRTIAEPSTSAATKTGSFNAEVLTDTPEVAYLEGVWVEPAERGKGIGLRCMSQLTRKNLADYAIRAALALTLIALLF